MRTLPAFVTAILLAAAPGHVGAESVVDEDPHAAVACSQCHLGAAARALAVSTAGEPDPRSRTCRGCHPDLTSGSGRTAVALGFHDDPRANCAGCHSFHERGRLKTMSGDLRTGAAGLARSVPGHCAACHQNGTVMANLSAAHRTAASLYHRDAGILADTSPSQGCLNCHAAGSPSTWQRETGDQILTFNLHATHPLGVEVVAGSGQDERLIRHDIDPRLRLFGGKIECQTCHCLTSPAADLLIPFETAPDLCLGCHQLRNARPRPPRELLATMMAAE